MGAGFGLFDTFLHTRKHCGLSDLEGHHAKVTDVRCRCHFNPLIC